jgi:hypothetical protein
VRGVPKGEENVRLLGVYLDELAAIGCGLPARDGRPNLSVIADACGFGRGVFYNNDAAKKVLDDAPEGKDIGWEAVSSLMAARPTVPHRTCAR